MNADYDYFEYMKTPAHQARMKIMCKMIRRYADTHDKLLCVIDIGIGDGSLTTMYRTRNMSIWGCDIDEKVLSDLIDDKTINRSLLTDVERFAFNGIFDLIVMGEVLEHTKWPFGVLNRLFDSLVPGGCLVGSVPNVGQLCDRLNALIGGLPYQINQKAIVPDYEHQSFFTRRSLYSLLHQAGFSSVTIETNMVRLRPGSGSGMTGHVARLLPGFGDRLIWKCIRGSDAS